MNLYEQLSDELLAGFFVEINKKITKGILSEAMYQEIDLIKVAAAKRGFSELDLYKIYEKALNIYR